MEFYNKAKLAPEHIRVLTVGFLAWINSGPPCSLTSSAVSSYFIKINMDGCFTVVIWLYTCLPLRVVTAIWLVLGLLFFFSCRLIASLSMVRCGKPSKWPKKYIYIQKLKNTSTYLKRILHRTPSSYSGHHPPLPFSLPYTPELFTTSWWSVTAPAPLLSSLAHISVYLYTSLPPYSTHSSPKYTAGYR